MEFYLPQNVLQDIKYTNSDGDAINIELTIMEDVDVVEARVQVYDYVEKNEGEAPLFPYLKDYLSIHPLFQMQNGEDESSDIYYQSKTFNYK